MKKIIMLFALALVCVGMHAQTLLSRSFELSPSVSYTVFEPKKDTVYYCRIVRVITPKVTDSFYLKFDGWNKLVGALNFMMSLEGQEKGRKYQINSSLNKNTITTGKQDGFLFIPSEEGLTISNGDEIPSQFAFYSYSDIAYILKGLNIEVKLKKQKKRDARNNSNIDDAYKY
nr:MAG TPA: Ail/Lom protein [Caudoviricetes sp.]